MRTGKPDYFLRKSQLGSRAILALVFSLVFLSRWIELDGRNYRLRATEKVRDGPVASSS